MVVGQEIRFTVVSISQGLVINILGKLSEPLPVTLTNSRLNLSSRKIVDSHTLHSPPALPSPPPPAIPSQPALNSPHSQTQVFDENQAAPFSELDCNDNIKTSGAGTSSWKVQDLITPHVFFSGLDSHTKLKLSQLVTCLGGVVTDQPRDCSHLVMDRLARTINFLMCLPRVKFVIGLQWMVQSGEAGRFISEKGHMLTDPQMEKKYSFSLAKTLTRSNRDKLYIGKVFYISPSVTPSLVVLTNIITNSGGRWAAETIPRPVCISCFSGLRREEKL